MILSAFKPETPPLGKQIELLFRMINAEALIGNIQTVQADWDIFAGALEDAEGTPDQALAILRLVNPVEGKVL